MSRLQTLFKREYWENSGGFFWAPVWTAITILTFTVFGIITAQLTVAKFKFGSGFDLKMLTSKIPPDQMHLVGTGIDSGLAGLAMLMQVVLAVVLFFYLLHTLYDERKDRSVFFWKSMPVSDTETVLTKVAVAAIGAPLISAIITVALHIVFLLILSITVSLHGVNPYTVIWGPAEPSKLWFYLFALIPLHALWALPTIGWILLATSYARSKAFLWAVALPIVVGVIVGWLDFLQNFYIPDTWYWEHIFARVLGGTFPGWWAIYFSDISTVDFKTNGALALMDWKTIGAMLSSWETWIGAIAGSAMISGAVYLRRFRSVAD